MQKVNIDLNSLFNFSYNFENLKLLLTSISKNQDLFEVRMKELEKKIKENKRNIELIQLGEIEINKQGILDHINDFISSQGKKETNKEQNEIEKNTIKSNKKAKEINIEDDDDNYKENNKNKLLLNELDHKLLILEDKVKLLYNFIPSFPEDKTQTLNNILDEHQMGINDNSLDIKEMKEQIIKMKNDMDRMTLKMNDFSVFDIFKGIPDTGGDTESSKLLIQAVDKKNQERFQFFEDKFKNDEEELLKLKNEINNLKNNTSFEKRNIMIMKEQIIKIQNEIDLNKKEINEKINKNKNDIESIREKESKNIKDVNNKIKDINNKIEDLSNLMNNLKEQREKELKFKNDDEDNSSTNQIIVDGNFINIDKFNELKESLLKKINNLDKKYQSLNSEIKNEYFEKELNDLKIELSNKKPTQQEFYDLSVQVQQFTELFETMKEENNSLQSDMKKTKDTISSLTKKYENIILQSMNSVKMNDPSENFKNENILKKFDDYVEISIFNEFIMEQTKFSEKLKKDFDIYRQFYDQIIETLKKAASVQDLKNLEDYFVDLLDEFKDKTFKLFPRKSDINKNIKSLDFQIKQIYEYLMKKDEHIDNWMLAKKPLGGYSCASCDNYIGDLKENNEKVLWNKLPEREIITNTNNSKLGNGFSRLLSLVNINKEIKNNNLFNSTITKHDYGSYKNELSKNKPEGAGGEKDFSTIDVNNLYINNTSTNKKTLFKEFNNNLNNNMSNANIFSVPKNNFSQEEMKFGFTSSDNMNIFKEMKAKKFSKDLPPINLSKEETNSNNLKNVNLSTTEYFEEEKDFKIKKDGPKVMKIIRKKNK